MYQPEQLLEAVESIYSTLTDNESWTRLVPALASLIAIEGEHGEPRKTAQNIESLLKKHVDCASKLLDAKSHDGVIGGFAQQCLDQVALGIALVADSGEVAYANEAFSACTGLEIGDGTLATIDTVSAEDLCEVVSIRASRGLPRQKAIAFRSSNLSEGWYALMLLDARRTAFDVSMVRALFELTEAEAVLAIDIASGGSLDKWGEQRGVSINTTKTHLKRILAKTGCHRQGELIAKLLLSPAAISWESFGGRPAKPVHGISVKDRWISFIDRGPKDGVPVVFLHGFAGSRHQAPPDERPLFDKGVRLLLVERPGYGFSDALKDRTPLDCAKDVRTVLDHLAIKKARVLGYSLGARFATVTASTLGSQRVDHLYLLSPLSPIRSAGDLEGMMPLNRMMLTISMSLPRLSSALLRLVVNSMARDPAVYYKQVCKEVPLDDLAVLRDRRMGAHYQANLLESARQGHEHLIEESKAFLCDWTEDAASLEIPTSIWHGTQDRHVPCVHAERLHRLIKGSTLNLVDNAGHFLLYHHWPKILSELAAKKSIGG